LGQGIQSRKEKRMHEKQKHACMNKRETQLLSREITKDVKQEEYQI
jgi:hypothetical protein